MFQGVPWQVPRSVHVHFEGGVGLVSSTEFYTSWPMCIASTGQLLLESHLEACLTLMVLKA